MPACQGELFHSMHTILVVDPSTQSSQEMKPGHQVVMQIKMLVQFTTQFKNQQMQNIKNNNIKVTEKTKTKKTTKQNKSSVK